MYANRSLPIAIAFAMLASGLALAAPATAHDLDPKQPKTSKSKKATYVGLGIGDHIVDCIDDETPGEVTVYNPVNGNKLAQAFPPEPKTDVCLGGASQTDRNVDESSSTPPKPSIPDKWQVWVTDWVLNTGQKAGGPGTPGAWDLAGGTGPVGEEVFPIAAFATMEVTIEQHDVDDATRTCESGGATDTGTYTEACVETPDADRSKTKQIARFAVCGKGGTEGIDTTAFDERDEASDDAYELTKTVYVDGPLFYGLDCLFGTTPVSDVVEQVHREVNKITCDQLGAICIFPPPETAARCWVAGDLARPNTAWSTESKHQIAGQPIPGMGIVGNVGWNHDSIVTNEGCAEATNPGGWLVSQDVADVELDSFPVQTTSSNDNYS